MHTENVTSRRQPSIARQQARVLPAVTKAALDAGHEPRVEHVGTRFKLVCSCGWTTPSSMTRKAAFQAVANHVWDVGRAGLQAEADTPEVVDQPQTVGGRG